MKQTSEANRTAIMELLEQQIHFNRTILNASVDGICPPVHADEARQLIRAKGGFASYVLDNSRVISEILEHLQEAQDGDSGAA